MNVMIRMTIMMMRMKMTMTPTAVHPSRMPRMAGKSSNESLGFEKLKSAL